MYKYVHEYILRVYTWNDNLLVSSPIYYCHHDPAVSTLRPPHQASTRVAKDVSLTGEGRRVNFQNKFLFIQHDTMDVRGTKVLRW